MRNLIFTIGIAGLIGVAASTGITRAQTSGQDVTTQRTSQEYAVGPCRFRIANMFGGEFREPYPAEASPPQGTYYLPVTGPSSFRAGGFSLFCVSAKEERITSALNGKYVDGRWWTYGPINGPEFVPYERQAKAQTILLKERNWTAIAYTEDATTGEERKRARVFHFCLVHELYALCGYKTVKWLSERKGRNDLDRVKAILETVEFVDGPEPTDVSPASAVAPVNK
ncbi:hypothetical protein LMG23992_02484 [Cupriavidus laharis]|uniref:Uncharacterized protein n=1 Tax=Cupriavidus laharis TaxID=151654 RepID=A0ABM8X128_9BURK|nr:hypothetical protein [Cupriavidus laharis]CAG9173555.1 hypothetical protein LMG23992_02484 [Cupriavidus laharis]